MILVVLLNLYLFLRYSHGIFSWEDYFNDSDVWQPNYAG